MDFFRPHWWIFFICLAVYLVAYFSLVCFYCTRHTFPLNLALLIVLVNILCYVEFYLKLHNICDGGTGGGNEYNVRVRNSKIQNQHCVEHIYSHRHRVSAHHLDSRL